MNAVHHTKFEHAYVLDVHFSKYATKSFRRQGGIRQTTEGLVSV